jgi:hypothetical protein
MMNGKLQSMVEFSWFRTMESLFRAQHPWMLSSTKGYVYGKEFEFMRCLRLFPSITIVLLDNVEIKLKNELSLEILKFLSCSHDIIVIIKRT